tara:strand:+ start:276 stop:536 length:261 start_codon:yes stop_codon:yes gene_type:complete
MVKYPVKKLFRGYVSIRDYVVSKAIRTGQSIEVEYEGEKMVLKKENLTDPEMFTKREFQSQYGTGCYELYDFKWNPVDDRQESLNL